MPPTVACKFFISNIVSCIRFAPCIACLTDSPFEADFQQGLGLYRKLHWQFPEHLLAESVDDHGHGVLFGNAALQAVEQLVLADPRCGGFVFDFRRGIAHFDVGKVCAPQPLPISIESHCV